MANEDAILKIGADVAAALQGLGQLGSAITDLSNQIKTMSQQAQAGMKQLPEDIQKGGTAATFFGVQLSKAYGHLVEFAQTAITALPRVVSSAADLGDKLQTMSQRTDVSVEMLSKLRFVSSQTGVSIDVMARTIQDMGKRLLVGSTDTQRAVEGIGLNFQKLKAMKPEDAFVTVLESLKQLPTAAERAKVGTEIFGNKFRQISQLTTEDIGGMLAKAKELGLELSTESAKNADRFNDAVAGMRMQSEAFRNQIGNALIPTLTTLMEMYPGVSAAVVGFADTMGKSVTQLVLVAANAPPAIAALQGLGTAIKGTATAQAAFAAATWLANTALVTFLGTVAAGAVAIGAFVAVVTAGVQAWKLWGEASERSAAAERQSVVDKANLARASAIAKREITDMAEAMKVFAAENERLRGQAKAAEDPFDLLGKSVTALDEKIKGLTQAQREQIVTAKKAGVDMKPFMDALGLTEEHIARVVEQVEKQKKAMADLPINKFAKEMKELSTAAAEAATHMSSKEFLEEFGKKAQDAVTKAAGIKGALEQIPPAIRQLAAEFKKAEIDKVMDDLRKKSQEMSKSMNEDAIKSLEARTKAIADALIKGHAAMQTAAMATDDLIRKRTLSTFDYQVDLINRERDQRIAALQESAYSAAAAAAITAEALEKVKALIIANKELQNAMTMFPGLDPSWIVSGGMSVAESRKPDTFATSMNDFLMSVPMSLARAFEGGGNFMGAIKSIAVQGTTKIGESIGKSFATLGAFGGPIGAAIGALAGPLIDMFAKMLDNTVGDIKDVAGKYGAEISDEVANAIKKSMEEKNLTQQAATLFNFDKLFPKITKENLDGATRAFRDIFSMIATGQLTVAQGAEVIEKNWKQMADAHTDASGRISKNLKEIIDLNRRVGTESKAIADFMRAQADAALGGFAAVVQGIVEPWEKVGDAVRESAEELKKAKKAMDDIAKTGTESERAEALKKYNDQLKKHNHELSVQADYAKEAKQQLADLGVQAVATFAAAMAAGMTFTQALVEAQPGLQRLAQAYEDLGIKAEDAALNALLLQSNVLEATPALMEAIGGLESQMIALDNMGILTNETFEAMQRTAINLYQRLQGEIHNVADDTMTLEEKTRMALLPMQGYLQQAAKQAELLQIPLDANTQLLIDQSKQLGLWQEAGADATTLLTDAMKDVTKAVRELVDFLKGVREAVEDIPDEKTVTIRGVYESPEEPRFARGGMVYRATRAIIGEGGEPEIVGPIAFMERALRGAMESMNSATQFAMSGGTSMTTVSVGDIHVNVATEGLNDSFHVHELARVIKREIEDQMTFGVVVGGRT